MLTFQTPCLIPSFSSKGSMFRKQGGIMHSDNYELITELEDHLYNSYLISAYDLYYGYIPQDLMNYPFSNTILIDSGGYEISDSYDMSEKYRFNYNVNSWNESKMIETYQMIYEHGIAEFSNLILTTYDLYDKVELQIQKSLELQDRFARAVIDFLIKPASLDANLVTMFSNIKEALPLKIIGFTEKELGLTLNEKLRTIAFIKNHCEAIGWDVEIHIFGGLEPNVLFLYYLAGASIFDGLSWQKVRYTHNSTLHNPNMYIVNCNEAQNRFLMMIENLHELERLQLRMKAYMANKCAKEIRSELIKILSMDIPLTIQQVFKQMEV